MRITIIALLVVLVFQANGQNIFPVKLSNCEADRFCLDCGDTKANFDVIEFSQLLVTLNNELDLQGVIGFLKFQVLVSVDGSACVLSHDDESNNAITLRIIERLNQLKKWKPAITDGKKEKSSINIVFVAKKNRIFAQIERVDQEAFQKSFDRPFDPEIYNKDYLYKNESLKNYKFTVWNSKNSNLPDNSNDHIAIEKNGLI